MRESDFNGIDSLSVYNDFRAVIYRFYYLQPVLLVQL